MVATCYTHAERSRVWLACLQGGVLYMQIPTGLCGVHKRMEKYLFLKLIACWNNIRWAKRVHKTQTFWPIQYFGCARWNTMCENSFNGSRLFLMWRLENLELQMWLILRLYWMVLLLNPVLSLTCCASLGKLVNFSIPSIPQLQSSWVVKIKWFDVWKALRKISGA